ncbi:MAG: hypothetical protein ACK56T_09985, partial [Dolichospermum sp.]
MRRKVRELKVLQQVALSEVHLVRASCLHHKSFIINTGKYMSQNNLFTHKKPQLLLAILTFTTSCFFPILPSKSQNIPLPSQAPLELDLL